MYCKFRSGDAFLSFMMFLVLLTYSIYEAATAQSLVYAIGGGLLVGSFFASIVFNYKSRAADDLRAAKILQQRMLGVPPEEPML